MQIDCPFVCFALLFLFKHGPFSESWQHLSSFVISGRERIFFVWFPLIDCMYRISQRPPILTFLFCSPNERVPDGKFAAQTLPNPTKLIDFKILRV